MSLATLWKVLTLSCDESTELVSASLERELTRGERVAMKLHGLGCWSCRRLRRQILFLREALRRRKADWTLDASLSAPTLSPEARQRIRQVLARGISDDSL